MDSDQNKQVFLKRPRFSLTNLLSIITLIIVAWVLYSNLGNIETTLAHLKDTKLFIFLLLIPEQGIMLLAGGKIFFSFLSKSHLRNHKRSARATSTSVATEAASSAAAATETANSTPVGTEPNPFKIARISLESNFIKQAFPSAGISAATYLSWRLHPYGFTPAQTSFLVLLRYFAIVCFNQLQTLIALVYILIFRPPSPAGQAILTIAFLLVIGAITLLILAILIVSSRKRTSWFVNKVVYFVNFLVRKLSFGKKRKVIDPAKVEVFLTELNETYRYASKHLSTLKKPLFWGAVYSFLEIGCYWVVATSLGHPELLPEIMIGEAIGSIAGAVLPYGPYELSMAGAMASLGVDLGLAGLIVLITRVFFLGENFVFGYICYQHSLSSAKRQTKPAGA